MEGNIGRTGMSSMVVVVMVAILVGIRTNTVGGESSSSSKNCTAFLDVCDEETATMEECCNSLRTLVKDVPCFCTLVKESNYTDEDYQFIERACNFTLNLGICSQAEASEPLPLPPTNSTPASESPPPTNSSSGPYEPSVPSSSSDETELEEKEGEEIAGNDSDG
ncbi:unnamed protein product [Victoria cruziana]